MLKYLYLKYWSTETYSFTITQVLSTLQSKYLPIQVVFHETANTSCNLGLESLNQVASSRPVFVCFEMTLYLKYQSFVFCIYLLIVLCVVFASRGVQDKFSPFEFTKWIGWLLFFLMFIGFYGGLTIWSATTLSVFSRQQQFSANVEPFKMSIAHRFEKSTLLIIFS